MSGHTETSSKAPKLEQIQEFEQKRKTLASKLPLRPEISQLSQVFDELSKLKTKVLDYYNIDTLCRSLALLTREDELAWQKEGSIQDLLSVITSRMEKISSLPRFTYACGHCYFPIQVWIAPYSGRRDEQKTFVHH